jgi:hypothetical protein
VVFLAARAASASPRRLESTRIARGALEGGPPSSDRGRADQPLPPLKESDPAMLEAMARVLGSAAVQKFLNLESVVPNIVATVDNLPRDSYAQRLSPMKPIEGAFRVMGKEGTLAMAPGNAARYTEFVKVVEGVDSAAAVAAYRRLYPLFQQAYVELGYPNGYFNDRLVEVIDHLLGTPDVDGALPLATPHVLYEYANPELEERSAGQKAMLRVGRENTQRLKAKLREIRTQLVAAEPRR